MNYFFGIGTNSRLKAKTFRTSFNVPFSTYLGQRIIWTQAPELSYVEGSELSLPRKRLPAPQRLLRMRQTPQGKERIAILRKITAAGSAEKFLSN